MIQRTLAKKLASLAGSFPALAVIGPRQSGKTTLVKAVFPTKEYVSLEEPDTREYASQDPRGFLAEYPEGAILDEIQKTPNLFSYLQTVIDEKNIPGMFILTGSQHFLLLENISQTLAGRIALLKLLPLSLEELYSASFQFDQYETCLYGGFYPRIYDQKISPRDWHSNYIQTYVERDVRLIKNVHNVNLFQTFLKMCASRTGQLLNLSSLANDCGITHNTARAWLGILEASFIIFLLRPHHKNFNKRLVKMPKLYFYDSGLACYLAALQNKKQLFNHPLKGNLFESFVLSEIIKYCYNRGREPNIYFWRDKVGHEIDCLTETAQRLRPIEIKSGKTLNEDYFKNLIYWNKLAKQTALNSIIIYGGRQKQKRADAEIWPWSELTSPDSLEKLL